MDHHRLTRRISEYIYDDDDDLLSFSPPPPPPSHESHKFLDFWPFLILFLCLVGVAALVFTCITVLKRRYANSNRTHIRANPGTPDVVVAGAGDDHREFLDEDHGPVVDHPIWHIRTVGLTQSVIDSIAVFKYKDGGLTEETDCTICLNKFLEEETLRILPKCSHAFHILCIDTWLRSHQNCPLCRAPVVFNSTSNAQASAVEPDSEQLGETQVENSEDLRSNDQVMGNESFGGLIREVTQKNPLRIRVLSDISDHRLTIEEELQPMRRSVSLDASSASVIHRAVSGISQDQHGDSSSSQLGEVRESNSKKGLTGVSIARLMKSASFGYSLQKGPKAMMRSFSSFRRMSSRRQDSLLPL